MKTLPKRNWKVVAFCGEPGDPMKRIVRGMLYASDAWQVFNWLRRQRGPVRIELWHKTLKRLTWTRC